MRKRFFRSSHAGRADCMGVLGCRQWQNLKGGDRCGGFLAHASFHSAVTGNYGHAK